MLLLPKLWVFSKLSFRSHCYQLLVGVETFTDFANFIPSFYIGTKSECCEIYCWFCEVYWYVSICHARRIEGSRTDKPSRPNLQTSYAKINDMLFHWRWYPSLKPEIALINALEPISHNRTCGAKEIKTLRVVWMIVWHSCTLRTNEWYISVNRLFALFKPWCTHRSRYFLSSPYPPLITSRFILVRLSLKP